MGIKIKPMTKAELIRFFQDYRREFPDWEVHHDVVLVRSRGAIEQHIAFQGLRSGAYRPSCCVNVTIALNAQILFKFLDIKHRDVLPREHTVKLPEILEAMESQFMPPVRQPLVVEDVLRLAEEEVALDKIENLHYSSGLAALNAYVGNIDRALWWCDRVATQVATLGRMPAEWEQRHKSFASELQQAIRHSEARAFLDRQAEPPTA